MAVGSLYGTLTPTTCHYNGVMCPDSYCGVLRERM